ncbi:MAG: sigma-70 family RNA polymerase sigma factor [Actinomycetota bacterium]
MDEVVATAPKPTRSDRAAELAVDFEDFFAGQHERLFRALWLVTRNRHEAEEIVQDAFLNVWQRWDRVATGSDPVAYLYRTAMNLWRSRLRRTGVALRKVLHQIQADDEMAAVEERDAVVRSLASLPPRQRAAVVLMDVLDLSSDRAGQVLGVEPVTARVLAARARASLAKEMGDRDG